MLKFLCFASISYIIYKHTILHILSLFIFVLLNMVYLPFIMRLYLNSVFEVNDLLINCFDVMNIHNTLFFLEGVVGLHYSFYFAPFFCIFTFMMFLPSQYSNMCISIVLWFRSFRWPTFCENFSALFALDEGFVSHKTCENISDYRWGQ